MFLEIQVMKKEVRERVLGKGRMAGNLGVERNRGTAGTIGNEEVKKEDVVKWSFGVGEEELISFRKKLFENMSIEAHCFQTTPFILYCVLMNRLVLCAITLFFHFIYFIRELLADSPEYAVPRVIPELSTKRILTSELIEGIPLDRCVALDQESKNLVSTCTRTTEEHFNEGASQIEKM